MQHYNKHTEAHSYAPSIRDTCMFVRHLRASKAKIDHSARPLVYLVSRPTDNSPPM